MAELSLKISADFEEASRQFKALAQESEAAQEKITKFTEKFSSDKIDRFTERQKLAGAAITATKGEMSAMTSQKKAYEREIERLIKNGLSPESDAIKKLRAEYTAVTSKIDAATAAQKAQEQAAKASAEGINLINKAAKASAMALTAVVTATGAAVQKTAEMGDYYAKTARMIGMSAETFQELEYAARMSGVESNTLSTALQKLNKNIGDARKGTGTFTTELKKSNPVLLEQLKNVQSNEDAFNLMMVAMAAAPDEFTRATLAQSAFGKAGQELIKVSEAGAAGITELRGEVRELGIISNDTAAQSEAFLDAQARVQQALKGVGAELAEDLLPTLINIIEGFANFIAGIDNWGNTLGNVAIAITGVTVALTAYVAITKAAAAAEAARAAIKALTSPAGLAALVIGGLVAGIAAFVKHSNNMANAGEREAAAIKKTSDEAENLINSYRNVNGEKNLDAESSTKLLALYPGLANVIDITTASYEELLTAIEQVREAEAKEKAQKWIDQYEQAQEAIEENKKALEELGPLTRASSVETYRLHNLYTNGLENSQEKAAQAAENISKILGTIGKEYKDGNVVDIPVTVTPTDGGTGNLEDSLQSRLSGIGLSNNAALNEMMNQVISFLNKRADLEGLDGEARIEFYKQQGQAIINAEKENSDERLAAERAINEAIEQYQGKTLQERLSRREKNEETSQNEMTNQVISFLNKRADLEGLEGEARVKFYKQQGQAIINAEKENSDERLAAVAALKKAQDDYQKEWDEEERKKAEEHQKKLTKIVTDAREALNKKIEDIENKSNNQYQGRNATQLRELLKAADDHYNEQKAIREQFEKEKLIAQETNNEQWLAENAGKNEAYIEAESEAAAAIKAIKQALMSAEAEAIINITETTLSAISDFAQVALNAQQQNLDERLRIFDEKAQEELENENLTAEEKTAIEERQNAERNKIIDEANNKAYGAAVAQRAISTATAVINTYSAAVAALADAHGGPLGIAAMIATITAGLAQVMVINSTSIPKLSAETGGRFMVPDVSPRVDSAYLRVNPGETVDVTPRSMTGSNEGIFNINLLIDGSVLASVINKKARAGELYTLQLAGNL